MDHTPTLEQDAVLATGVRLPILRVATILSALAGLLADPAARSRVAALRQAAVAGADVEERHVAALVAAGLALSDSRVDPEVREVVLAAVRGEGEDLRLVSPFTTPEARAAADAVVTVAAAQALLAGGPAAPPDDPRGLWVRLVTRPAPTHHAGLFPPWPG